MNKTKTTSHTEMSHNEQDQDNITY
jgi:hypothetical protein